MPSKMSCVAAGTGLRDQEILGGSFAFSRAHPLAAMQTAGHAGNLVVGMAEHGIVVARIDDDAVRHFFDFFALLFGERAWIPHQTLGLPGLDPLQLFRKSLCIGGGRRTLLCPESRTPGAGHDRRAVCR